MKVEDAARKLGIHIVALRKEKKKKKHYRV